MFSCSDRDGKARARKLQALFKPLLISHWPKLVTWPSPASVWEDPAKL